MLTETIEYFVDNTSPVYGLFVDASKAFDRVSHIKLFEVLRLHGIRPLFLRSLFKMYTHSEMHERWKEAYIQQNTISPRTMT